MIVVCYNENNQNNFDVTTSLQDFKKNHINAKIIYTFNEDDDIDSKNQNEEQQFANLCGNFGFLPSDYNATMMEHSGNIQKLTGFKPKNKKYKCIVLDIKSQQTYKCTPQYVKTCITRYNNHQTNIAKVTSF